MLPVYKAKLAMLLDDAAQRGYDVIAAVPKLPDAQQSHGPLTRAIGDRAVLVMGSEGRGLRHDVWRACNNHLNIRAQGEHDTTLNVSAACAVALHMLRDAMRR